MPQINFENFLNFEDFLADPAAALKAAQRKVEEAVEEEERKLRAKKQSQEEENRKRYERAIASLSSLYSDLRTQKNLDEIENQINSVGAAADRAIEELESQISSLKRENQIKDKQIEDLRKELEETKELQQKLSSTLTNDQKNQVIRQLYNKGIILTADDYYNDFIDEHSEELDFAEAQRKLEEHKQRLEQEIIDFENEEFEENPFAVNLN